jgi:hypothetical protein
MSSVWATRPSDVRDLTGYTEGTLKVSAFSHRDAGGIKWHVECTRCGDRTIDTSRRILDGHLRKGCRIDDCRLNRLPEKRITAYEKWLDAPEPVAAPEPEPAKAEPVQRVEPVTTDYLRYVAACQKTGTPSVPFREFQQLGPNLHRDIMARVATVEEKE